MKIIPSCQSHDFFVGPGLSGRSETTAQSGIIDVGLAGGVENMSMCLARVGFKGHTDRWVGEKREDLEDTQIPMFFSMLGLDLFNFNDSYPSTVKVYVSRRWIWVVEHLLLLSANYPLSP